MCKAILFIKAKVFVNMRKPNLAFFNMEVITTAPNPTHCAQLLREGENVRVGGKGER